MFVFTEVAADAVIDRSACTATVFVVLAVLLAETGSLAVVLTVAVSEMIVPLVVADASFTTTAKEPVEAPAARL